MIIKFRLFQLIGALNKLHIFINFIFNQVFYNIWSQYINRQFIQSELSHLIRIRNTMNEHQILINQLRLTLIPQYTQQATKYLNQVRTYEGFTRNLLLISDNQFLQSQLKLSAIVYLKNLIEQQCKNTQNILIPLNDLNVLKQSLLEMLIKTIQKKQIKILPTLKYICYLFSKFYYKENKWSTILPQLLSKLQQCQSFDSLKGTLTLTKIIFQIIGKSITEEIKLNNLSNKILLPLINVASKMFADFSDMSCLLLQDILTILTQAIQFNLPQIVRKNIHVFMVLIKNILDVKVQTTFQNQINHNQIQKILKLKKFALIFLQKMYQRHSTSNLISQHHFVVQFNLKYTKAFFQTIVGILITQKTQQTLSQVQKQSIQHLKFDLNTHALGIFSFIAGNKQCQTYVKSQLQKYQIKILYITMERFLNYSSRKFQNKITNINNHQQLIFENYTDFIETIREQRQSLRLFISTIFSNRNIQNRQKNIEQILQLLLKCIIQGSYKQKQLSLYLMSSLQRDIQLLRQQTFQNLNQKLIVMLKQYIFPLLTVKVTSSSVQDIFFGTLVKLRAFQIYAKFQFLEIGPQEETKVCETIFQEICRKPSNQLQIFVKVQAIQAFNSILATNHTLVPQLSANIPQILRAYTDLLSQEFEVMKFYEQILSLFSEYIQPVVYELLELLTDVFFKLSDEKKTKFNSLSGSCYYKIEANQEEQDYEFISGQNQNQGTSNSSDDQTIYQDFEHKYENIGSQCLGSIKKLIFKHRINSIQYVNSDKLQNKLYLVILQGLSSGDETFTKQSLSILNLLLYKGFINQKFRYVFTLLLYPIYISNEPNWVQRLQMMGDVFNQFNFQQKEYQQAYKKAIKFIIHNPYSRVFQVFDVIGCLKNFIKILQGNLYTLRCNILNKTYLQMLVQAVQFVEEAKEEQCYSKSQSISILSIYEALFQNKIFQIGYSQANVSQNNFKQDQYFEVCLKNLFQWKNTFVSTGNQNIEIKQRLESFYIRILMLALFCYPFEFFSFLQKQIIGSFIPYSSEQYPINQVLEQLNIQLVQKVGKYIKPKEELKQANLHLLNDSYILLMGLIALGEVLMGNFVLCDSTNNFSRPLNIIQSVKSFTRKVLSHVFSLSLQIIQLMANQVEGETSVDYIALANQQMQKKINQQLQNNVFMNSSNQKQKISQNQGQFLIKMLNNLNVGTEQSHKQKQQQMSLTYKKSPKLQIQYQHYLKKAEGIQQLKFYSSEGSQDGSKNSCQSNPFDQTDQEFLYAYDSPIFGGSFTENRKKQLKKIILDLINSLMSQKMNHLHQLVYISI